MLGFERMRNKHYPVTSRTEKEGIEINLSDKLSCVVLYDKWKYGGQGENSQAQCVDVSV